LIRASINLQKEFSRKLDGRVKPGHDAEVCAPALQRTTP
jgi:hypothetical protein